MGEGVRLRRYSSKRPSSPRAFARAVELRRRSLVTASARLRSRTHCGGHMPRRSLRLCRRPPVGRSSGPAETVPTRPQTPAFVPHYGAGSGAAVEAGRGAPVSRCAGIKGAPSQPPLFTGNRVWLQGMRRFWCLRRVAPPRPCIVACWLRRGLLRQRATMLRPPESWPHRASVGASRLKLLLPPVAPCGFALSAVFTNAPAG